MTFPEKIFSGNVMDFCVLMLQNLKRNYRKNNISTKEGNCKWLKYYIMAVGYWLKN